MGWSGTANLANALLNYNRSLRNRRKIKNLKDLVQEQSGSSQLEFKEISPQKLAKVKAQIREKAIKQRWREFWIKMFVVLFILTLLAFLLTE